MLIGVTGGFALGIIAGYVGGAVDLGFQRIVDAMIAFPSVILAMAIMAVLGASVNNVIIALVFVLIPPTVRAIRAQVLSLKEMDYVLAAKAVGCSPVRVMVRHIVPNCFAIYIILATITLGFAIIVEASLSFLGIGVPPGTPTWGGMLTQASQQHIKTASMGGHSSRRGYSDRGVLGQLAGRCPAGRPGPAASGLPVGPSPGLPPDGPLEPTPCIERGCLPLYRHSGPPTEQAPRDYTGRVG